MYTATQRSERIPTESRSGRLRCFLRLFDFFPEQPLKVLGYHRWRPSFDNFQDLEIEADAAEAG